MMMKARLVPVAPRAVIASALPALVVTAFAVTALAPAALAAPKERVLVRSQVAASAPQPLVLSVSASPAQVGSHGGSVSISGHLEHASTCRLRLLSRQSFPVVYASNARQCTSTFSAHVTVGANPTPVERSIAFALVARNGEKRFAGLFYVSLAPLSAAKPITSPAGAETTTTTPPPVPPTTTSPAPAATTTTSPATTTTVAPTTTTTAAAAGGPPVTLEESPNWSGYSVKGGPFTSVSGTFTVPSLTSGASCDQIASEWVGVDGAIGTNNDLIQSGVTEAQMDPSDSSTCQPGQFYAWAWWEIIPAAATNVYSVPIHAGDSITVSISQQSAGTWQMSLTDNTDGRGFSVQQPYSGPGQSAEWVTEAPAAPQGSNQICPITAVTSFSGSDVCPLAPYSPPVGFSSLALSRPSTVTEVDEIAMVQGSNTVSTPSQVSSLSQLLAHGFTTPHSG